MRQDHRRLALEVAEKSIVLLKNRDSLLPLTGQERVAVIGRLANVANTGDEGSSNTHPAYVVTPLEGLRESALAAGLTYDDGNDAARAAQVAGQADLALVVVGYTHLDEGEFISPGADPEILKLFPAPVSAEEAAIAAQIQQAMAGASAREGGFSVGGDREAADAARGRRSSDSSGDGGQSAHRGSGDGGQRGDYGDVARGCGGNPHAVVPGHGRWSGAGEGSAGANQPGRSAAVHIPAPQEDLPAFDRDAASAVYDLWHGYRKLDRDGASATFPFGFGLSYTTFEYVALTVESDRVGSADTIRATVTLANTGPVAGDEVVQMYVRALDSRVERARRELKGFARVRVKAGASAKVVVEIPAAELAYYDVSRGWIVEPGRYVLMAGRHAEDAGTLERVIRVE